MILNLTQHKATPEQVADGVIDAPDDEFKELISFDCMPSHAWLVDRAVRLAKYAKKNGADAVMVGGAPFFMSAIEWAMKNQGIKVFYAFSKRESIEKVVDGKTVKQSVFSHVGLVRAFVPPYHTVEY